MFTLKKKQIAIIISLFISSNYVMADSPCILSMGWTSWPPFMYANEKNQVTGKHIELIKAVTSGMGCHIKFKEMPWKRLLLEVKKGHIDMAAGASWTKDRAVWAHYSEPYINSKISFFILKVDMETHDINSFEDIKKNNFQLGVLRGAYYGQEFERLSNDPEFKKNIQVLTSVSANVKKLLARRIDGYFMNHESGIALINKMGKDEDIITHPSISITDKYHVIMSKKSIDIEMLDKFNTSLDNVIKSGTYDEIMGN
ncbi:transporter substrate-binding domain-containing protein [Vibrio profundum]|uniref:substrate-binding periplasmic protein n=1 Tax=Vibrio profundum TaxID=2910247 RepID=UPI003D0F091D